MVIPGERLQQKTQMESGEIVGSDAGIKQGSQARGGACEQDRTRPHIAMKVLQQTRFDDLIACQGGQPYRIVVSEISLLENIAGHEADLIRQRQTTRQPAGCGGGPRRDIQAVDRCGGMDGKTKYRARQRSRSDHENPLRMPSAGEATHSLVFQLGGSPVMLEERVFGS